MSRIMLVVEDADMRCRHEGLLLQAVKKGVKRKELRRGNLIVFLNRAKSHLSVLGFRGEEDVFGVLSSYKSPHGRVPLEAVQYIPEMYGADGFSMDRAIKEALTDLLARKKRRLNS